jgi:hypothetical protein
LERLAIFSLIGIANRLGTGWMDAL